VGRTLSAAGTRPGAGRGPPTEEAAAWLPAAHEVSGGPETLPPGRGKPTWGIVKVIVLRRF